MFIYYDMSGLNWVFNILLLFLWFLLVKFKVKVIKIIWLQSLMWIQLFFIKIKMNINFLIE